MLLSPRCSVLNVVSDCRLTKKSRGIGYVQFVNAQDAISAMRALDGDIFQGRLLHILPARKVPAPAEPVEKVTPSASASCPSHSHTYSGTRRESHKGLSLCAAKCWTLKPAASHCLPVSPCLSPHLPCNCAISNFPCTQRASIGSIMLSCRVAVTACRESPAAPD